MNSPIRPGQKAIGANAARVVAVAAITGMATSAVASFAASFRSYPCSRKRKMFSTTTIALSTSIPSARMRLKSTTMFIVKPMSCMMLKESSIESGIAMPTNDAFAMPRKKSRTATTRISPEMMLFSRFDTIFRMSCDWSEVIFTTVVGGKLACASWMTRFTASDVSMMFSPVRFTMPSVTTGLPSRRA